MQHKLGSWATAVLVSAFSLLAGQACAADGDFIWAKGIGGSGCDAGNTVTLDDAGNVYTTGYFAAGVDFDPGPGTCVPTGWGGVDIFVSKCDSAGNFLWAKSMGGAGNDFGYAIAVDEAGNVYTAGTFQYETTFDLATGYITLTSAGGSDIFVSKRDRDGNFLWVRGVGGTGDESAAGMALDSDGNICITGSFYASVDFDPGAGVFSMTSAGDYESLVWQLDNNGNFVWAKQMGGTGQDTGRAITLDGAGNILIAGNFEGTADFDPGPDTFALTATGALSLGSFLLQLDNSGNFVWAKALTSTELIGVGSSIALDNAGNIHITGFFSGTADVDPGPGNFELTAASAMYTDIFLAKLDSNGNLVWARRIGGTDNDFGRCIAVDGAGYVHIIGDFIGTVDFDPGSGTFNLTSASSADMWDVFVSKLDRDGNFVLAMRMGGTDDDRGSGIALDSAGYIHTTGYFSSTVDFDPGAGTSNLTAAGRYDIFMAKFHGTPDTTAPKAAEITPTVTGPTRAENIEFTVVFDEPVLGFSDSADVVLSVTGSLMCSGVKIVGSGNRYTVTVTDVSGKGTLQIAVNTQSDVTDREGNPLAESVTSGTVIIDPQAPGLPLSAWPLGLALLSAGAARLRGKRNK